MRKLKKNSMPSRRKFLHQAGLFTLGSVLMDHTYASTYSIKDKKIGIQLYTLRNEMAADAIGSLKKLVQLGFGEVENFGYNDTFFGMKATEYKKVLGDLGLKAPSGHYLYGNTGNKKNPGTILYGWDKAIEDAVMIGQQYMVLAYLSPEERTNIDAYKKIADELNNAGEKCKKAGIQLCYHNHDFEFQPLNSQIPFDILSNETDKTLLQFELDLYWTVKAGYNPLKVFNQNKGRISLWHVKDMDNTVSKHFTEVGKGVVDFVSIFKNAKVSGMKHFFIEQDQCPGSPFDSAKQSIGHVKNKLIKLL